MSKGAFNGLLKGKLGNTIFYKVTNSSDKEKQGQRQYVASIANPRTAPQATQRMRMKPAINFYRGLADLLDHSWEGVKYGALSRQKFMQLALSPTLAGVPYVDKGESRFIPGNYPLSMGSVGANVEIVRFADGASFLVDINLSNEAVDWDAQTTWGVVSQAIINGSAGLRDGDELTFIAVVQNGNLFFPVHTYVVLDVTSTLAAYQVMVNSKVSITRNSTQGTYIDIAKSASLTNQHEYEGVNYEGNCVAAGVIVSRHPSRTSTTWLRSSSNLVCSDSFKAAWMSADRFAAALATYQNSATDLTSDWLLNQAENQGSTSGGSGGGGIIQNFSLENQSLTPTSGTAQQRAYYNDGSAAGFICDSYELVDNNTPYFAMVGPYEVENNTLVKKATMNVPTSTSIVSLAERPSVRQKIAQFYTFAQ